MPKNIFTKLRKKKKLTQPALAEKINVSEGYVSLLENNKKTPSLPVYQRLEEVLGPEIKKHFF